MRTLPVFLVASIALLLYTHSALAEERVTLGVAAGISLWDTDLDLGDGLASTKDSPGDSLSFGVRAGLQLTPSMRVEAELAIAPTETRLFHEDVTLFSWRSHLLIDVLPSQPLRPFLVIGAGAITPSPANPELLSTQSLLAPHLGLGFEFDLHPTAAFRLDMRSTLAHASSTTTVQFEWLAGVTLYFPDGPAKLIDRDHDGVFDDVDQCLGRAEDQDGFADEDGCPDLDNDGDGIVDAQDHCPSDSEDFDGVSDTDGCPE